MLTSTTSDKLIQSLRLHLVGRILHQLVGNFSVEVAIEGVDCSLNSGYLLRLFIGNVESEVLLHGNYQLH